MEELKEQNNLLDCFLPERGNLYPLCIGKGKEECKHCNLWVDWNEAGWPEK